MSDSNLQLIDVVLAIFHGLKLPKASLKIYQKPILRNKSYQRKVGDLASLN